MTTATNPLFTFLATEFVQPGYETDSGEWAPDRKREIESLRRLYPELAHWGGLALGLAFGDFSQDVLEVSWAEWMVESRDEIFLNYICWRQTRGRWRGGFDEKTLSTANVWKSPATPA